MQEADAVPVQPVRKGNVIYYETTMLRCLVEADKLGHVVRTRVVGRCSI
jgi:hypothetical protein